MPRNYYVVNKNRFPFQGGIPPGDFTKFLAGSITPTSALTKILGGPPPPQNFTKNVSGLVIPSGALTRTLIAPPSGQWPHQPPGHTRLVEHSFDKLPGSTVFGTGGIEFLIGKTWPAPSQTTNWITFSKGSADPNWSRYTAYPAVNGVYPAIIIDATAPMGGTKKVLRTQYDAGQTTGATNSRTWDAVWDVWGKAKELYFARWVKIVGPDFEWATDIAKWHGYLLRALSSNGEFQGMNGNNVTSTSRGPGVVRSGPNRPYPNFKSPVSDQYAPYCLPVGSWMLVEELFKLNTLGTANGTYTLWVNGSQQQARTGLSYIPCTENNVIDANGGWRGWHYHPIYGGGPTGSLATKKTRHDEIWWDHVLISGILQ